VTWHLGVDIQCRDLIHSTAVKAFKKNIFSHYSYALGLVCKLNVNGLRLHVFLQHQITLTSIWHCTSLPISPVHTVAGWHLGLLMAIRRQSHALFMTATLGGRSTSERRTTSAMSLSRTTESTVIVTELTALGSC